MLLKFIRKYWVDLLVLTICLLYSLAWILINLNRFWQYESGYYDFGLFDKAIWNLSRFRLPIRDHLVFGEKIIFADHFSPSIFLLSPLYWLTDRSEIIFIAQDILVGLSGFFLFKIGQKILKNSFLSFSVLISYFLFTGLQNAVFSDFHEITMMTLFLMLTYWTIFNNKKKLYFLFFLLTLGFKESMFLMGIGLSIFIYFTKKSWRNIALITFIISILWGFISIKLIIPFFSGGQYVYSPTLQLNFVDLMSGLFSPLIKLKTVFLSLASFLFLPLLSPALLPIFILHYIHRFIMPSTLMWDLGFHYNAEIAPTLAVGSILGLSVIKKVFVKKFAFLISILLITASFGLYRFVLHGPLGLAYHPAFYKHTKDFSFLDKMIAKVPANASVLAQNNLASRFLHQNVWILRENYKKYNADYILFDIRDGQNPSNYLGMKDPKKLFETIKKDKDYILFYHQGDQYIFKKK